MRAASLALALMAAHPAGADDYLMVFSAEAIPYRPGKAHTFAAVARVEVIDGKSELVELRSLSWLPAAGTVRSLALRPEKGRNVPLDETLRDAAAEGRRICLWGPYLIRPGFAEAFGRRVDVVEQTFRYKGASLLSPSDVCDCTRSLEEMAGPRRYIGVFGYGAAASGEVVRRFSPWIVEPERPHSWVAALIGLDDYSIERRAFGDAEGRLDQFKAALRFR